MTELSKLRKEKIAEKVSRMSANQLLTELEDTVQFDIVKTRNFREFENSEDTKVFWAIKRELEKRLASLENKELPYLKFVEE